MGPFSLVELGEIGVGVNSLTIIPVAAKVAAQTASLVLLLTLLVAITKALQDIPLPLAVLFALFTGDTRRHGLVPLGF